MGVGGLGPAIRAHPWCEAASDFESCPVLGGLREVKTRESAIIT